MASKRRSVRLTDVASVTGVSVAAVSMALSDSPRISETTKQRVRQTCEQMGYQRPSSRGKGRRAGGKTYQFGFMVLGQPLHNDTHFVILQAMGEMAASNALRFEFASCEDLDDPAAAEKRVLEFARPLDGLVLTDFVTVDLLARLEQKRVPHLVLGSLRAAAFEAASLKTHSVTYNIRDTLRHAVMRLIRAGHRRIAFVLESDVASAGPMHKLALDGYRLAHHDAGLPLDERLLVVNPAGWDHSAKPVDVLLSLPDPPTAYAVPDARIGGALVRALRDRGAAVDPGRFVVMGDRLMAARHGVSEMPLLVPDMGRMTRMAVSRLKRLCERPAEEAMEIVLACEFIGFDQIDACAAGEGRP